MLTASIVLYHNSEKEVRHILDCALHSSIDMIYVIDNSRNDILRLICQGVSDRIVYIHSENIGYGGAHNIAIRAAIGKGAKYHAVLNPDTYFESPVIDKLIQYMEKSPGAGLVMPKVLYPDGKIQYLCKLLPTPMDLLGRRFFPWRRYIERRNKKYELRFTDYNTEMEVPSLSGCFMFMRISILQQIGGFDERFFMYAEDIDLCRRIGEVAKTVYFPNVQVYHEYAKGSYKNKKLLKYHVSSVIKYFNKWGWIFDKQRRLVNTKLLKELNYTN